MKKAKSIFFNERLTLGMNFMSFGMLMVFGFIENPMFFTISEIGVQHRILFYIICFVWSFTGLSNLFFMFDKFEYKSKLFTVLVWLVAISAIIIAWSDKGINQKSIILTHWISAFVYMAGNPLIVLRLVIHRIKAGYKKYSIAIAIFLVLYLTDLGYMALSFIQKGAAEGKNGLLELVPIGLLFVMFTVFNHTSIFEKETTVEISIEKENIKSVEKESSKVLIN